MNKRFVSHVVVSVLLVLALSMTVFGQVRMGTHVDEVVLIEEPSEEKAYSRLVSGDIDLYAYGVANPDVFEDVQNNPALDYYSVFGSYAELTFNTAGPEFNDGRLNPFSSRKVREAMNWLVDRDYIAQELFGGLATPKYSTLNPSFADYARVVEKMRELESYYAYDLGKAEQVISEEMEAMGATLVNNVWHYNGKPVEIELIIRTEDAKLDVGDYVASQLEKIGFTTVRNYKAAAEANPIWLLTDPADGEWNVYTGAWGTPVVYRDQSHNFDQMYTPRVMDQPVFQALDPIPELDEISERLRYKQFSSMEERNELMERILELAFQDSPRIYLVDVLGFVPRRSEITVVSDLGGQVAGTMLWPTTLRREGEVGGTITIAQPAMLVDPWNPVAGSMSAYDQMPIRATMDRSVHADPFTGNYWAHRIERAEVFVEEGYPVAKSLDWVDLEFVDEIVVPEDAWVDWDAAEGRFITAAEKFPEGTTAVRRSVVYFPEDFYDTVAWHDGSPVTIGDIVFWFILNYDRGKSESPFFDESVEDEVRADLEVFRGMRILSEDPLIIESYSNSWSLDAEFMIGEHFPVDINLGSGGWHNVALGLLAELDKEAAFSADKAKQMEVDQLGYHTGPTIDILRDKLEKAKGEGYIPYASVLSEYIDADEVAQRYENLTAWYEDKGHFWIGTGPMYLERVYPVEKMVVLRRNESYPDPADRWLIFDEPRIPEIEIDYDGGLRVRRGDELTLDVYVTFDGEPYAHEHIVDVTFLVQDAQGNIAAKGDAEYVDEGHYRVSLLPAMTRELPVGANKLDVIVTSTLVGGAKFGSITFVSTP